MGRGLQSIAAVMRIYEQFKVLPEFVAGDWKHQPDTPKEFRGQT